MVEGFEAYGHEHMHRILDEIPEAAAYPHLANDLHTILRDVEPHTVSVATVRSLLQAVVACADPQRAVNHLLRYVACLDAPARLWTALQQHAPCIAQVVTVFAGSQFLSAILYRQPELLFWLLEEGLYGPSPTPQDLDAALRQLIQDADTDSNIAAHVRAFTHRHLLRIGARDLNDLADVEETTADLSALADCVVQMALRICQAQLDAVHGPPFYTDDTGQQHPCHFCVIGMGKLGGYELNFSSDIDLMYVYTSYQGMTRGITVDGTVQNQISNHEYFVALARRLTNLVGGKGPDGQAFRVDLRLRPDGTQGQLALSLLSYEAYYERLGQTWEKMALLKARPLAGDAQLGEEFMALIQPFIYRRHLDPAGIRQLQDMKRQIDAQIADKDQARTNVKLGLGGIREIEFFIQILQLLFGGRQPELQERHSLRALAKLHAAGLVSQQHATTLRQAYCYLRRLEHRLQMEQGAQTHMLPRHEAQRQRLARLCGYATWETFYAQHVQHTEAVHAIFISAFDTTQATMSAVFSPGAGTA